MRERILIVEDDPAISKLIDTNLALSGYQTVCAMDGKQAVDAIQAKAFDLALCDIMLPELDGFELLPYMKGKGMALHVQATKTSAGKRKLPMTKEVEDCFRAIVEDREALKPSSEGEVVQMEKAVDGYRGFLFLDNAGLPLVAMHWEHRFNSMVNRYNAIYKEQMPNITPRICRHTYCSNMAKAGMNPKTLQYLMGHSDITVMLDTYTHLGLEDAAEELKR